MKRAKYVVFVLASALLSMAAEDGGNTATPQPPPGEKPYGCFRDLKWGMSISEAIKSLEASGITAKEATIKLWGEKEIQKKGVIGEFETAGIPYQLMLSFDSTGLRRVNIDPLSKTKGIPSPVKDFKTANEIVDSFYTFYKSLSEKYGKPNNEHFIDRGADAAFINNFLNHTAVLSAQWITPESIITLTAEATIFSVASGIPVYTFTPLLVYEKGQPGPEKKADL